MTFKIGDKVKAVSKSVYKTSIGEWTIDKRKMSSRYESALIKRTKRGNGVITRIDMGIIPGIKVYVIGSNYFLEHDLRYDGPPKQLNLFEKERLT